MINNILGLVLVVALIAGNALFVAAEFSLVAIDRSQLEQTARDGSRGARRALRAVRSLSFQLSGAQLGITSTSLVVGYVAEPTIASLLAPAISAAGLPHRVVHVIAVVLALLIATITQMVFGELFPKNVAISVPMAVAERVAGPQMLFSRCCRPIITLLNGTANRILRAMGIEPQEELRSARSPSELGWLVRSSAEKGTLPRNTATLLGRSLRLRERTAQDVMTPRVQVAALHAGNSLADLLRVAEESGHSRFPVHRRPDPGGITDSGITDSYTTDVYATDGDCAGDGPDSPSPADLGGVDDIVGVIHVKDAFAIPPADRTRTPVSRLMVPPVVVPTSLSCDDLLATLRGHSLQLAVVIDEYGGTAGIVTLEDLIEELVGHVADEYDAPQTPDATAQADGSWVLSGLLRLDEVADLTRVALPDGPYETLAGLVLHRLGRIPEAGDEVEVGGHRFIAEAMDRHRIDRIRLIVRPDRTSRDENPDRRAGGEEPAGRIRR